MNDHKFIIQISTISAYHHASPPLRVSSTVAHHPPTVARPAPEPAGHGRAAPRCSRPTGPPDPRHRGAAGWVPGSFMVGEWVEDVVGIVELVVGVELMEHWLSNGWLPFWWFRRVVDAMWICSTVVAQRSMGWYGYTMADGADNGSWSQWSKKDWFMVGSWLIAVGLASGWPWLVDNLYILIVSNSRIS